MKNKILKIDGTRVRRGTTAHIRLKISEYFTSFPAYIPVIAIKGVKKGPGLFITAAVHGDEINGVEIIRRIITRIKPEDLRGTLICIPVVNIFGFYNSSRLLPDRRDLNIHFPGLKEGSSASRIAHKIFSEVIRKCRYGIDIHSEHSMDGAVPYVVGNMENGKIKRFAESLGTSVIIHSAGEEKSLLRECEKEGVVSVLYKAGHIKQFNEKTINTGITGIMNVLRKLDMIRQNTQGNSSLQQIYVREQIKIYTGKGGILNLSIKSGCIVHKGDEIGIITNPFGLEVEKITAPQTALVLGCVINPLVNPGTMVCQLAKIPNTAETKSTGISMG